jgi:hypothetical protein
MFFMGVGPFFIPKPSKGKSPTTIFLVRTLRPQVAPVGWKVEFERAQPGSCA